MALKIWNELTSEGIALMQGALVVVPIGSIEQHGPHLPVGTDIYLATRVAETACELANADSLLASVFQMGFSPHHKNHPGTISASAQTLFSLIKDIVKSFHEQGFRKVLFVNGHGGNWGPLKTIQTELAARGYWFGLFSYWDSVVDALPTILQGEFKRVGHACEFETALLLYVNGEAVQIHKVVSDLRPPWDPSLEKSPFQGLGNTFISHFHPESSGVYGDARAATYQTGKELFELVTRGLARYLEVFNELNFARNGLLERGED